jgi:luciferase family oxidoreductase group 1
MSSMSRLPNAPLSILDLAPIVEGATAADAFRNSLDLAQHAERWGYHRYWLAEHHNIPGVASAATSVVIGHIAGGTSRIRVGAGGIMLPNHAPLVIAEQFGTLESLYPGRIDLGLGRAPGGDQATARALRRYLHGGVDTFVHDVLELQAYFRNGSGATVRAIPGQGLDVPLWILGSSEFGAQLAAQLGLPYAFASHFAPDLLGTALRLYRVGFQRSESLERPRAMVGVNVIAAETDREAQRLATSLQRQFLNLVRGNPGEVRPPVDSMEGRWNPAERQHVERMTRVSAIGSRETVRRRLELILTAQIYDHAARLRSFEIAAEAARDQ